ncbi:MAG: hypothetical protein GYB65_08960 [Chloroflexi bacterium]|nr:hypothetical protein [Chloroflexota bacterium]
MRANRPEPERERPPEGEARAVISIMLVLTGIIAIGVIAIPGLSTSLRSIILIAWIGVMMGILRRYRL